MNFGVKFSGVQILASSFINYVILGKSLNSSVTSHYPRKLYRFNRASQPSLYQLLGFYLCHSSVLPCTAVILDFFHLNSVTWNVFFPYRGVSMSFV